MGQSLFEVLCKAVCVLLAVVALLGYCYQSLFATDNAFLAVSRGDYAKAVSLLERSAQSGNLESMASLANLHRLGLGVPKNDAEAALLYSASAHGGNVNGMVNLALMYRQGLGLETDAQLAYAWFNLAREKRSPVAQLYMSEMLAAHELSGHLVPKIKQRYSTLESMPRLP